FLFSTPASPPNLGNTFIHLERAEARRDDREIGRHGDGETPGRGDAETRRRREVITWKDLGNSDATRHPIFPIFPLSASPHLRVPTSPRLPVSHPPPLPRLLCICLWAIFYMFVSLPFDPVSLAFQASKSLSLHHM